MSGNTWRIATKPDKRVGTHLDEKFHRTMIMNRAHSQRTRTDRRTTRKGLVGLRNVHAYRTTDHFSSLRPSHGPATLHTSDEGSSLTQYKVLHASGAADHFPSGVPIARCR
ncbi:hypothetical protein Bbelb_000580 [Branchiostoma belcheri]|nr:hypothetical protein Bbelb_000580 [Branchiostoma belcheri]